MSSEEYETIIIINNECTKCYKFNITSIDNWCHVICIGNVYGWCGTCVWVMFIFYMINKQIMHTDIQDDQ